MARRYRPACDRSGARSWDWSVARRGTTAVPQPLEGGPMKTIIILVVVVLVVLFLVGKLRPGRR
jgi:hypothetical protein